MPSVTPLSKQNQFMLQRMRLFVGQIPMRWNEVHVHELFRQFGTLREVTVIRDEFGNSRGCAFVTFAENAQAQAAITELHDKYSPSPGRRLQVRDANAPRALNVEPGKVYISNLAPDTTEDDLMELFAQFGKIQSASVLRTGWGQSKCCALVEFQNRADAEKAISVCTGKIKLPGAVSELVITWARSNGPSKSATSFRHHQQQHQPSQQQAQQQPPQQQSMVVAPQSVPMGMMPAGLTAAQQQQQQQQAQHGQMQQQAVQQSQMAAATQYYYPPMYYANGTGGGAAGAGPGGSAIQPMLYVTASTQDYEEKGDEAQPQYVFDAGAMYAAAAAAVHDPNAQYDMYTQQPGTAAFEGYTYAMTSAPAPVPAAPQMYFIPMPTSYHPHHPGAHMVPGGSNGGGGAPQYAPAASNGGKPVSVASGVSQVQQQPGGSSGTHMMSPRNYNEGPPGANLFVKGFSVDVVETDLKQLFEKFGTVLSCRIFLDRLTGTSRGFGFVSFSNADDANKAIEELNGQIFGNGVLSVSLKRQGEPSPRNGGFFKPNSFSMGSGSEEFAAGAQPASATPATPAATTVPAAAAAEGEAVEEVRR